ncbi:hypothetical protein [Vibrio hippocampi]|uniref:Heat-shock protein HtpX n=1 Tax=Vibrio hippocampi TaxID=654686 RepID=A0ABM8ZIL1_9VIBR|nr:hypothetical protein [Vibrio hippocampi]CAH0526491.1 hypothetical protein VHP8226_01845 [Vibrio hippocampi]
MVENKDFQMAIDLLCCHLGISEDEAKQQLGIQMTSEIDKHLMETQAAMLGMSEEK